MGGISGPFSQINNNGGSVLVNADGSVSLTPKATFGTTTTGPFTLTSPNQTTPVFEIDSSVANQMITIRPTIPETPTASQNAFYFAGQNPLTMTAAVDSYVAHIRGWGQGSSTAAGQMALRVHFPASTDSPFLTNYTGNKLAAAINAQTDSTSTGITPVSGFVGNMAIVGYAAGIGAGWNLGVTGRAAKSTGTNVGVLGYAIGSANSEVWNIGVLGVARQASQISNSGYFYAGIIEPSTAPAASSVLAVDAAATAVNLVNLLFNGGNVAVVNSRGHWTLTPTATAGGVTTISSTPGAHTAVIAEVNDYNYAAHTMTITGGYATQRFALFGQPTISAVTALTVVTAATVAIAGAPLVAGIGPAAITNNYALLVQAGNIGTAGKISLYNNVATLGWGVHAVYGYTRVGTTTNATATLATYTVGAADGSFLVSANVNVTTSTTVAATVTCVYTDETNTSRTLTLPFTLLAGSVVSAITTAQGNVPYEGLALHIRAKASTTITIATAGTVSGFVYTGEGMITQVA